MEKRWKIYEAAMQLTVVECKMLNLKKTLCDGSMLKGHTAKVEVIPEEVNAALKSLKESVATLENNIKAVFL